jgi:ElaB/YqjD/DUF883 family membrane-anchored ribosome-binding protein
MTLLLAFVVAGCSQTGTNSTAQTQAQPTTSPGPDNSEITTSVDANGTRTETRTFRNNPHISKVTVTTRNGQRTVKATSPSGEEKVVDTTEDVLHATGDKVASAAGFVADKGEDVAGEAKDKAGDVKDKTVSTTKKVANEVGDKAEDVKDKTVSTSKDVGAKTAEGAKKVGSATVTGAKKAGSAVKKVIP